MLQIHPDAIEAEQARQLIDRRIEQMERDNQGGLVAGKLRLGPAGSSAAITLSWEKIENDFESGN